jgi:hypothetical protein
MALETLTSEHWLDIREAVHRRLNEVANAKIEGTEARQEQARRLNSLKESLDKINDVCRDLKFEEGQLPF